MENLNPTFISFLVTCVIALSGFIVWLVKKIIHLTADCHEAMIDVKNAVRENSQTISELKTTLTLINNNNVCH